MSFKNELCDRYPLIALKTVVFPYTRSKIRCPPFDVGSIIVVTVESRSYNIGTLCKVLEHSVDKGNGSRDKIEQVGESSRVSSCLLVEGLSRVTVNNPRSVVPDDVNPPSKEVAIGIISKIRINVKNLLSVFKEKAAGAKLPELDVFSAHPGFSDIGSSVANSPHSISVYTFQLMDALFPLFQKIGVLTIDDALEFLRRSNLSERLMKLKELVDVCVEGLQTAILVNGTIKRRNNDQLRQMIIRKQIQDLQEELKRSAGENSSVDILTSSSAKTSEHDTLVMKFQQVRSFMHSEAVAVVEKEFGKLKSSKLSPQHPEYHGSMNYLDQVLALPWEPTRSLIGPIDKVVDILDRDHYGMHKVKRKIAQILSVHRLQELSDCDQVNKNEPQPRQSPTTVLCLWGPPGVGKTSIAESIAECLGRKFVRISLGGLRDSAELKGHRRTYIGAMPGVIIQAIIRSGVNNPVILLDEVDKVNGHVGRQKHLLPSAENVMLELLDPTLNSSFKDHYLNFGFDLSNVVFICTCNELETISRPLRDRLDILPLEGYLENERVEIAKRYLLKRNMHLCGLLNHNGNADSMATIAITDDMLHYICSHYTAEAGVRELNRRIADICKFVAADIVNKVDSTRDGSLAHADESPPYRYEFSSVDQVIKVLGPPVICSVLFDQTKPLPVGVAVGLAVTPIGGDVLFIESLKLGSTDLNHNIGRNSSANYTNNSQNNPSLGNNNLSGTCRPTILVTGQLGDVMRESVQASLSLLISKAIVHSGAPDAPVPHIYSFINPNEISKTPIHVHFPNGAVPKDGPSAGVGTVIALASLFSGVPARSDVASTGEITLRGDVLPIGGVRNKVLAAYRAGIKTVILPWSNRVHESEIPQEVLKCVELKYVQTIDHALSLAFQIDLPISQRPYSVSAL